MTDFKPIETEEEFQKQVNEIIRERLARQKESLTKELTEKYSDYDDVKKQLEDAVKASTQSGDELKDLQGKLEEANNKIHTYEISSVKNRVAHEVGLPYEFIDRIKGDNKEEITKDAESLAEIVSKAKGAAPVRTTEPAGTGKDQAMKTLLEGIKGE